MTRRSDPGGARAPLAARLVLLLGTAAALALFAAAWLDFGDPGANARSRLEAAAESEGRLVQTRWRERLQSPEWLAPALEAAVVPRDAPPAKSSKRDPDGDELDEIRLVAARAAAARGDLAELRSQTETILSHGGRAGAEALLQLVRHLRGAAPEAAGPAFVELAADLPWSLGVEGTSGRLLALLSAAPSLPPDSLESLAREAAEALGAGACALPEPADLARFTRTGIEFAPDSWWQALQRECERRLPARDVDWSLAFQAEARRTQALVRAAGDASGDAWSMDPLEGGAWLARRTVGDKLHVAVHTADAFAFEVRALALRASDLVPLAFAEDESLAAVAEAGSLEAAGVPLVIAHPDPEGLVRRERRRLTQLRWGLVALALLVLTSTTAAARSIAKARELGQLRSTFVASVSHDLRTPLASIGLMAENLASGYAQGNEERYVDSIQRETARLRRLVDDLLDFGRLERGLKPIVSRTEVELEPWLESFAARERARCTAAGCAFSVERGETAEFVRLDTDAIERALSNLIDNALKHSGTDAIRLRVMSETRDTLTFAVEDAGRGLERGLLHEHLFEPFRRQGESGGTGLGLAIVRAIAKAHGGEASLADRSDGSGLVATLCVSCAEEDAA